MSTSLRPENRLDTEVQYLKGVGPKWNLALRKLDITTVRDILYHFPRRYEDRTQLPPIRDLTADSYATIKGDVQNVRTKSLKGGRVLLTAEVTDGTGTIQLVWFNQPWIRKKLEDYRKQLIAYGMVKQDGWSLTMPSPEIEMIEDEEDAEEFARIVPVYPLTEGLPQKLARRAAESAIATYADALQDPLPDSLLRKLRLKGLVWSLRQIHRPDSMENQKAARRRLVFEEFFYTQLAVQMRRNEAKQELGISFPLSSLASVGVAPTGLFGSDRPLAPGESLWDEVHRMLPFELTGAQKRVIGEIWADMERPAPMNRLVQGDVGSGKTAVAACAMLAAVRSGYQTAMMAPTEILAEQHYINLHRLFDPLGIHVSLLTGKLPAARRKKAQQQTKSGEARIVVGTHALIQEAVEFNRLGLCVIDEQHRFGVMQRAALRQKGTAAPDVLVMTATPIPRTLTMTLYADLDVSIIDELPPGRKAIKTHWRRPDQREMVFDGVRKLIESGRQAYFVCPAIAENEKVQTQAAEELHLRLSTQVFPDLRVGLLHGQLKAAEKEEVMLAFRRHELDILVATVVIEVGVDVPNASIMVIEDANRFGLAQLHQLRGRVGRGEHQSFCILIAGAAQPETQERMQLLTETSDGFKIAEADLRLRGPGEIAGTRQSGTLNLRLADLVQDSILLEEARQAAMQLLEGDPSLSKAEHRKILERVREQRLELAVVTVS